MGQVDKTTAEVQSNLDWEIEKASSSGIKIDTASPDWGWKDIIGDVTVRGTGGSNPTLNVYNGGDLRQQQFSVGDEVFNVFHLPHDYALGTDMYIHAHWSHNVGTVTSGGVTWGFEIAYSKGHDQAAFVTNASTLTIQQDANTTQYQHMIAEVQMSAASPATNQVDTDLLEVDGLILVRTFLSGNTMNGTPEPFLHTVDIHYQSTGIPTKNRAPDFYT